MHVTFATRISIRVKVADMEVTQPSGGARPARSVASDPMPPFLAAVGVAAAAVFIAEFGDKSQLLVLAFATRAAVLPVVVGLVVAAAVVQGASVLVGAWLGASLPEVPLTIIAGLAFLAVAAWTLLGDDDDVDEEAAVVDASHERRRPWVGTAAVVAGTFIVGELGDKTMLATFALAARNDPLATWIGATAGMVAANLVAVAVGRGVGSRLAPRAVRIGSAALFAIAGVVVLSSLVVG
jgi:putative Ca2+/H+ antiporter (TMEM165/GDT1 family)